MKIDQTQASPSEAELLYQIGSKLEEGKEFFQGN